MEFKKFIEFLTEKKKSDKKDIEEALPEKPKPEEPTISTTDQIINATKDYYNAKTPQWNPKGKIRKKENNQNEEE